MRDPLADQTFDTRREAARASRLLGCTGAHQTSDGWMPCRSEEELDTLITHGARAFRRRFGTKTLDEPKRSKKAQTPSIKDIIADVDAEVGELKTFEAYQTAFQKVFPNAKIGVDEDITAKQRGGSYALIYQALRDPETAALVGLVTTGTPAAGVTLASPVRAPLGIVIGDGDSEEEGVMEALHLWGHLAGLSATYENVDPATVEALQTWVNQGGEPPKIPGLKEMNDIITNLGEVQDTNGVLVSFGIDAAEQRVDVGLRAVAARFSVALSLAVATIDRSGDEEDAADAYAKFIYDSATAAVEMPNDPELELRLK